MKQQLRQSRNRWRILALTLIGLNIAPLFLGASLHVQPAVLRASQIEVVNADGVVVMEAGADADGAGYCAVGDGKPDSRIKIRIEYERSGGRVIPTIAMLNKNGTRATHWGIGSDGYSALTLAGGGENHALDGAIVLVASQHGASTAWHHSNGLTGVSCSAIPANSGTITTNSNQAVQTGTLP